MNVTKKTLKYALLCTLCSQLSLFAADAEAARVCRVKVSLPTPEAGTCDIDSTNTLTGNPFAYIDPTQGCDFNFSLPGLPSFSLEGLSSELCNAIQSIGQTAIDDVLGPILDLIPVSVDYSLEDAINSMFKSTEYLQSNYCPEYDSSGTLVSYTCASDGSSNPSWAATITGPTDDDGSCVTYNGTIYCTDSTSTTTTDEELPLCSSLDSLIDSNGYLIQCRNDSSSESTATSSGWDY